MNRVDWMTPEEVLLILAGWAIFGCVLAVGAQKLLRQRSANRQVLRDIADLDRARRAGPGRHRGAVK